MATTSDVKVALSEIANYIKDGQIEINKSKNRLQNVYNILDAIPTTYASEMAEIDGYTPSGAFEALAQDEKSRLTTDFQALKTIISDLLAEFPS